MRIGGGMFIFFGFHPVIKSGRIEWNFFVEGVVVEVSIIPEVYSVYESIE